MMRTGLCNEKRCSFSKANSIADLYNIGPYPELVNRETKDLSLSNPGGLIVEVRGIEKFENVDLSSQFIPSYIAGRVRYEGKELALAIAINGRIRTVTKAFHSARKFRFAAIVPPSAFVNGKNTIEIIAIPEEAKGKMLLATLD